MKRLILMLALSIGASTANANEFGVSPVTYQIGDQGPAGGIVFYISPDGSSGMEAASHDVLDSAGNSLTARWGCYGIDIPQASEIKIGTGRANTAAIITRCKRKGTTAALLASQYKWQNGQTDGFLPSKDELHQLYLHRDVVGGFANGFYRSSSESDTYYAWSQSFSGGYQNYGGKNSSYLVRAVRAF
ncbi:MAG: DUF1566 domain-containing protein [Gammaproteobacteria bacterium]|jgi:hypothetical protein|nr:DUF1566 domain-containing protein [Gammaproteobacteria bacterium]MBT5826467.1 DUF1566 domain-containing protein [Gammaproteobacteria bacterium]MBT6421136.1 DUF1566 domain-containing protein [Gammaproteobacteria bacterium]MBT6577009.1 DUF1566 domain-containing protein [Gammaproteobacteria bacterium]